MPAGLLVHLIQGLSFLNSIHIQLVNQFIGQCPLLLFSALQHWDLLESFKCSGSCLNNFFQKCENILVRSKQYEGRFAHWLPAAVEELGEHNRNPSKQFFDIALHQGTIVKMASQILDGIIDPTLCNSILEKLEVQSDLYAFSFLSNFPRDDNVREILERCTSDNAAKLQPLACMYLFVQADERRILGNLNLCPNGCSAIICSYNICAKLFETNSKQGPFDLGCNIPVNLMQKCAHAIERLVTQMPLDKLNDISSEVVKNSDVHLQVLFNRRLSKKF